MKGSRGVPAGMSFMVNARKNDRVKDEDLTLFREMNNRNRITSLLHPLSDEFDHSIPIPNAERTGTDPLYRISSTKKGSSALDFLAENDKHDYDWLKTPPATPLFPSIEMEAANAPQLIPIQREILVLQPLSRFTDRNNNGDNGIQKSLIQKPKPKPKPKTAAAPTMQRSSATINKNIRNAAVKPKEISGINFDASNSNTKAMMRSSGRAVSPFVRSTLMNISGLLSNETPPNLRTTDQRSTSAMRGRAATPTSKPKRQSCSPAVARGRREPEEATPTTVTTTSTSTKGGLMGSSRMVDKVMNARIRSSSSNSVNTNHDRFKDTKPNYSIRPHLLTTSPHHDQIQSSGFGRMSISKTSTRDKTRSY